MPPKLPRPLLLALVIISITSFTLSLYVEIYHLPFLQNHPIMANLLSGVVGFSTAAIVVGIGFNRFHVRANIQASRRLIKPIADVANAEYEKYFGGAANHSSTGLYTAYFDYVIRHVRDYIKKATENGIPAPSASLLSAIETCRAGSAQLGQHQASVEGWGAVAPQMHHLMRLFNEYASGK